MSQPVIDMWSPIVPSREIMAHMAEHFPPDTLSYLDSLLVDARGDVDIFKEKLKAWYNETQDRANGWYKRKLQLILFWMGFACFNYFAAEDPIMDKMYLFSGAIILTDNIVISHVLGHDNLAKRWRTKHPFQLCIGSRIV